MSVIKEISVFNGSTWESSSIGANASNITLSNNIAGNTNLETALSNILPASQLSANAVVVTDGNKRLTAASNVSTTELGYLSGLTRNVEAAFANRVFKGAYASTAWVDAADTAYPQQAVRIRAANNTINEDYSVELSKRTILVRDNLANNG